MAQLSDLVDELNIWKEQGNIATFWWRDDDLTEPTSALDRLLNLQNHFDIPLTLAIIPERASPSLLDHLEGCTIVQHGYQHLNFAPEGDKKSEFPDMRGQDDIIQSIKAGKGILSDIFKDQFYPVFVPPWNRIGSATLSSLAQLNYLAVSRYQPRAEIYPEKGLLEINTHVDVIDWRNNRRPVEDHVLVDKALNHLRARRKNSILKDEPTGLLTHHLVHDEEIWASIFRLLSFLTEHESVRWVPLRTGIALNDNID
jgi:hypothetical protein